MIANTTAMARQNVACMKSLRYQNTSHTANNIGEIAFAYKRYSFIVCCLFLFREYYLNLKHQPLKHDIVCGFIAETI